MGISRCVRLMLCGDNIIVQTIDASIVHFVIKVPKMVQMIVTIIEYRVIKYPLSIKDGRHEI